MKDIKERLSQLLELDYEEIKADGRKSWQQLNPEVIIDEETWQEIWHEIEQIFKAYIEKEKPGDDEFIISFCQTIDYWKPFESPVYIN